LGKRNFKPCDVCNAKGLMIGAKHVKSWKSFNFKKNKE
jgi:hypothetical protein